MFASPDRESLDLWASQIILDGEVLDLTRTAPSRWVDGPIDWWHSEGVPVLGTLSVGDHLIESTFTFDSMLVSSFATDVHVADC